MIRSIPVAIELKIVKVLNTKCWPCRSLGGKPHFLSSSGSLELWDFSTEVVLL